MLFVQYMGSCLKKSKQRGVLWNNLRWFILGSFVPGSSNGIHWYAGSEKRPHRCCWKRFSSEPLSYGNWKGVWFPVLASSWYRIFLSENSAMLKRRESIYVMDNGVCTKIDFLNLGQMLSYKGFVHFVVKEFELSVIAPNWVAAMQTNWRNLATSDWTASN